MSIVLFDGFCSTCNRWAQWISKRDSKGIFQRYEDGLALLVNRSNYQRAVLMRSDSFRRINVFVDDTGLHRETVLEFETTEYKGRFITSYSSFKSQAKFFRKLDLVEV